MSSNILAFKADLAQWSKVLDVEVAKLLRYITLDLYNMITERNPVDTGYSRSQWKIGIGEPDESVDAKPPRGSFVQLPVADLARLAGVTKETVIYITNAVDYVQYLEEGSSQQAPSGMVRISLAEAESKIDSYVSQAVA